MTFIMFLHFNFLLICSTKKSEMNIIFMLIIASLFIAIIFFILFVKSVKAGQYDDVYTPSVRMLFDDELVEESKTNHSSNQK